MTGLANPAVTIDQVATVARTIAVSSVDVYVGRAPQGARAPFANIAPIDPAHTAAGLPPESYGRVLGSFQVTSFGESPAQAEALRAAMLNVFAADTTLALTVDPGLGFEVYEDTTDDPTYWAAVFVLVERDG